VRTATPKRAALLRRYRPLRDAYLADHEWCEFPGCTRRATCLHHKAGRRGLRLIFVPWFAASCDEHNEEAESGDVLLCRELGWLLPMDAPIPLEEIAS
jgi:hypothetical protein